MLDKLISLVDGYGDSQGEISLSSELYDYLVSQGENLYSRQAGVSLIVSCNDLREAVANLEETTKVKRSLSNQAPRNSEEELEDLEEEDLEESIEKNLEEEETPKKSPKKSVKKKTSKKSVKKRVSKKS